MAGLLLERDDARAQVVEQPHGERVARRRSDVVASPVKLRIISLTPLTPIVEKWLRSVPR